MKENMKVKSKVKELFSKYYNDEILNIAELENKVLSLLSDDDSDDNDDDNKLGYITRSLEFYEGNVNGDINDDNE